MIMTRSELKKRLEFHRFYSAKTNAAALAGISTETLRKYLKEEDEKEEHLGIHKACKLVINKCNTLKGEAFEERKGIILNKLQTQTA